MFQIQRSAILSIAVTAALAVQVGCGDGSSKKQPARVDKTLPGAKDAKTIGKTPNPLGVPKADPEIAVIEKKNDGMVAAPVTQIQRDDLPAGTYEIQSTSTYIYLNASQDDARAITKSEPQKKASGYILVDANDSQAKGMLKSFKDSGRKFEIPLLFAADLVNKVWTPKNVNPANLEDVVTSGTSTIKSTDKISEADNQPVSVLGMLAEGGSQIANKSYTMTDANGVKIYLRLYKVDEQTYRMLMVFEEHDPKRDPKAFKDTFNRSVYIDYSFKPAEPVVDPNKIKAEGAPESSEAETH